MQVVPQLDTEAIERLRKQSGFLLGIYHAEIANDPASRATEFARSNVIALQHTVRQLYGEGVAREVASLTATLT
jgi:hypothetical protein